MATALDGVELSWEHDFRKEDQPNDLWRVLSTRNWDGRTTRQSNWFADESAAWRYVNIILDKIDCEVIGVTHYQAVAIQEPTHDERERARADC